LEGLYIKENMMMEVVKQVKIIVPDLASRIKQFREKDGRSVQVLATAAGISTAYWYEIEKGKRHWISEEVLRGIENALGVDLGVQFDD
jgi:transcriptional regulator with XRE-family HTH domain